MNLPIPYGIDRQTGKSKESLENYNRRLSRSSLPLGTGKSYKAKRWCNRPGGYRQTRKSRGVVFDMVGDCKGKLEDVLELGQILAREALEAGDTDFVVKVVARMKRIVYADQVARLAKLEAELEAS